MGDDLNDFGFTTTDGREATSSEIATLENSIEAYEKSLNDMHALFDRFLENLAKNPENEYIKWPNRDKMILSMRKKIADMKDLKNAS